MSKRTATSQSVGSPNGKRIRPNVSYLTTALNATSMDKLLNYRFCIYDCREMRNIRNALEKIWLPFPWEKENPRDVICDRLTQLQARVRGVIARGRVIPSMLSPDPTDLRQAVLFCANGCK